jgi:hypothetical protein
MAIIQKIISPENLEKYGVFLNDTDPNSKYFKITELPDTFTGGKNAFLIQGSEYLVPDTLIKVEIKDAKGDTIYYEPGEGIISSSVNGESFVTEYYEGVSKVVSVYIYPDTAYGPCTITILGEISSYESNGLISPIPTNWEGEYNVKWQKQINVNPALSNSTKIRFYKRPTAKITEILNPIYSFVGGNKVASAVTQSFANIKLSNLETFAGDVKRIKVFRTSLGDISDYDLIQDILVESKELLTTYGLSGSVVGNTGIFTSEVLKNQWNSGSLNATLNNSRVEAGVRLTGSGYFRYTQSLDLKSTNTYELNLDAFYSSSTDSNLGIYLVSGSTSSSIGTLIGTSPTKNLLDTTIPFTIDRDYPTASLYLSQSRGEWHVGNISLKLSEDTAFSPDEVSFVTTMPTVLGNETFNFKFEFYDVNNNYVPVAVTQSALFNGGNNNVGGTLLYISSSASSSLADLNRVSSSISGTMTTYSSSASSSVGLLSSSVSTSVLLLTSSISSSLSSSFGYTSGSVYILSGSVSASTSALSSSISGTISSISSSISQSVYQNLLSSFAKVQLMADGNYSGSFISGNIIYAPVIGGQLGYFSTLFKVGKSPNSIYLDARQTPRKIFIGGAIPSGDTEYSGAYNNTNTNVYLDSSGQFSLKDKLTFDTSGNLTVNGTINVTGGNAATDANAQLYASRAVTSGSNSAAAAQSAAELFASSAAGRAVTSGSNAASAAEQAAINQAKSDASASINLLANGNWTAGSGTFITARSISSPILAGNAGYISEILKVGQNGITLDGGNKKIFVGNGNYNNPDTPFYFASGSSNVFSLGDKLSFNGNDLSVNGGGTFSGNISAATGTFTGGVSGSGYTLNNSGLNLSNAGSSISVGNGVTLSSSGLSGTGFSLTTSGVSATQGSIGGWTIGTNALESNGGGIQLYASDVGSGYTYGWMNLGTGTSFYLKGSFMWVDYSGPGGAWTYRECEMPQYETTAALNQYFAFRAKNQAAGEGAIMAYAQSSGNWGVYSNAKVGATSFPSTSDRRAKSDIKNLDSKFGIDFIKKLNPVEYKFNDDLEHTKFGFIAQEVSSSILEYGMNVSNSALVDGDINNPDRILHLNYTELIAPLVKSIQQLTKKIENLEAYISGSINK